jgi:hypothetical protein
MYISYNDVCLRLSHQPTNSRVLQQQSGREQEKATYHTEDW